MAQLASLDDAVEAAVHDGDTVALQGFTHLIPFAVLRPLIATKGQIDSTTESGR